MEECTPRVCRFVCTHACGQTDRQKDRQTPRQADRQTDRQIVMYTQIHTHILIPRSTSSKHIMLRNHRILANQFPRTEVHNPGGSIEQSESQTLLS